MPGGSCSSPASLCSSPCWRSTSWATGCRTPSTRGGSEPCGSQLLSQCKTQERTKCMSRSLWRTLLALAALVAVLGIGACGGDDDESADKGGTPAQKSEGGGNI